MIFSFQVYICKGQTETCSVRALSLTVTISDLVCFWNFQSSPLKLFESFKLTSVSCWCDAGDLNTIWLRFRLVPLKAIYVMAQLLLGLISWSWPTCCSEWPWIDSSSSLLVWVCQFRLWIALAWHFNDTFWPLCDVLHSVK